MVVEYFLRNVWRSSFWDRMFSQPLYFNYRLLISLVSLTNRSVPLLLLHPKECLNHPRRGKPKKHLHNRCHLNSSSNNRLNRVNLRKWLHSQQLRKDRLHLQKQLRNQHHSRHHKLRKYHLRHPSHSSQNQRPQLLLLHRQILLRQLWIVAKLTRYKHESHMLKSQWRTGSLHLQLLQLHLLLFKWFNRRAQILRLRLRWHLLRRFLRPNVKR